MLSKKPKILLVLLITVFATACSSMYYGAMEKVGYVKREIMVDRVEEAQEAQEDSKEEFKSALEAFQSMFGKQDTELQKKYDILSAAYEDAKESADEVKERIDDVEDVADALFDEWEDEIELYENQRLKNDSQQKLRTTRSRYNALLTAMRRAEGRAKPVLTIFHDQVLYLKHNLNAQAIDGLQTELRTIEGNVATLVRDLEKSIAEAGAFIEQLKGV